jgi:hypothetical protein
MPDSPLPTQEPSTAGKLGRAGTYVATWATKGAGIYVFLEEASKPRDEQSSWILMVCAALMLGAQVVENVLLKAVERVFGADASDESAK